jgi:hypothetical protein
MLSLMVGPSMLLGLSTFLDRQHWFGDLLSLVAVGDIHAEDDGRSSCWLRDSIRLSSRSLLFRVT